MPDTPEGQHLLRTMLRYLRIFGLLILVFIVVYTLQSHHANTSLDQFQHQLDTFGAQLDDNTSNIDNNTDNINSFGAEVHKTKELLQQALERASANNDPTLTARINKGLQQIDALCQKTNCEG